MYVVSRRLYGNTSQVVAAYQPPQPPQPPPQPPQPPPQPPQPPPQPPPPPTQPPPPKALAWCVATNGAAAKSTKTAAMAIAVRAIVLCLVEIIRTFLNSIC